MSANFARLTTETFLADFEHYAEIGSTNDRALQLCTEESLFTPYLVLADRQTSGRGRGSNRWWSSDGALLFSLIIEAAEFGLPESRWPLVSLTAGVAVCQGVASLLPSDRGHELGLKWPNDVWLNGRKACGILVEVPPTLRGRLVIGIGLNVNNSFTSASKELQSLATSLHDETDANWDRDSVLLVLLRQLEDDLKSLAADDVRLPERWQTLSVLTGRDVTLEVGQQHVSGRCLGIATDGGLRLQRADGERNFYGGTVKSFSGKPTDAF